MRRDQIKGPAWRLTPPAAPLGSLWAECQERHGTWLDLVWTPLQSVAPRPVRLLSCLGKGYDNCIYLSLRKGWHALDPRKHVGTGRQAVLCSCGYRSWGRQEVFLPGCLPPPKQLLGSAPATALFPCLLEFLGI